MDLIIEWFIHSILILHKWDLKECDEYLMVLIVSLIQLLFLKERHLLKVFENVVKRKYNINT